MIRCIVIAEGEWTGDVYEFVTEAEHAAFAQGVSIGANQYGAGACGVYTRDDLQGELDADLIEQIQKHLPE